MPKVYITSSVLYEGYERKVGDELEVSDEIASKLIDGGFASKKAGDVPDVPEPVLDQGVTAEAGDPPAPADAEVDPEASVAQLRKLAKERGLTGLSKAAKPAVLEALGYTPPA